MTLGHWIYLIAVISVIILLFLRKGAIISSIVGIFALGLISSNHGPGVIDSLVFSLQSVFNAFMLSFTELLGIILVIALMVGMLDCLKSLGADEIMISPLKKLMKTPWLSFIVLAISLYIAALFFWPTPAIALVGVILIPVARLSGLPNIGAAVAVSLAGHGMALAADPIIQGAPKLTADAANIAVSDVIPYSLLFSFTVGLTAISIAAFMLNRQMKSGKINSELPEQEIINIQNISKKTNKKYAKIFAVITPLVFLIIIFLLLYRSVFDSENAVVGSDATALIGGAAATILLLSSFASHGIAGFNNIAEHLRNGFYFAIKIFSPIIPIAAFFFLGQPDNAVEVLGQGTPGYLFDMGNMIGSTISDNPFLISSGTTLIGMMAAMDGAGFSALPLSGSIAASLAEPGGYNVAVVASLAQVAVEFVGGGTLCVWAFGVAADSGIAGVSPSELVKWNLIPVLSGIFLSILLATFLM